MPAGFSCLLCVAASAQQAPPASGEPQPEPEVIVVTGERVPRTLRETASSVDVSDAERIESLSGADRIEQVLEMVPNVQLGAGGEGPTIRGQDTTGVLRDLPGFLGGSRPRTTLQVDGRAVSFNEFVFGAAPLWDIERAEVFRTPQTTTQGRNSIAGAIFVHSKDPTFEWEGRARLIGGNYDLRQASAVLSGPIVTDQLAVRMAGDLRRSRAAVDTVDLMRGADPNHDDYSLLRVKALATPDFWPGSRVEVTYAHTEAFSPPEVVRPPFRERRDPLDRVGAFATDVDSLTATADYPIAGDLTGSTTATLGDSFVQRFSYPGLGETKSWIGDLSAETLLDWDPAGPARIVGGASWLRSRLEQFIDLSLVIGLGEFDDRQSSVGLFGEASIVLAPRTTLTAGLRYQRDRQRRVGVAGTEDLSVPLDYDETFSAWLPKVSLAYDFTDAVRAGVLVQKAYNPGGTTLRFDTGQPESFDAETLWNYELFVRASPAPGLSLAGNAFYTDIRDSQRAVTVPYALPGGPPAFFAAIANVPRARTYGFELTADWRAGDRLEMRAAIGLLDTRITHTDDPDYPALGKEFRRSPPVSASASVDWRPVDLLRLSVQARHNGRYYSDDFETRALRVGRVTIVDARAGWSAGRFTVFGYVRNLFDAFDLRAMSSPTSATAIDPREFGVGLEGRF